MDSLGKQGFPSPGLTEEYNWNVRPGGQRGQLETTRHGVIACSEVFEL
jgi:hypothetical protein